MYSFRPLGTNFYLLVGFGGKEHDHASAFHLAGLIQRCHLSASLGETVKNTLADLGVCHLTTAETNRNLDAIAVGNKFLCIFQLRVEIAHIDVGRHTDFFDLDHMLIFAGFFLALALLKAELAVIHELADGRSCLRGYFHQVEPLLLSDLQSFCGRNDAELCAIVANETNFFIRDFLIQLMCYVSDDKSTYLSKIQKNGCLKASAQQKTAIRDLKNHVDLFAKLEVRRMLISLLSFANII